MLRIPSLSRSMPDSTLSLTRDIEYVVHLVFLIGLHKIAHTATETILELLQSLGVSLS